MIDETGVGGAYDFELAWGEDRIGSVTAALRDGFGLQLTPAKRDMEALIVDQVRPDATLVLLAQAGRLTRNAPPYVRQRLADVLAIR